jgi:hypothetical protein
MPLSDETRENMANLMQSLIEKDGPAIKRLAKKHHPDLIVPEIELEDKIDEVNKGWEEKYNALEAKFKEVEGKVNVSLTRTDLKDKGYSKEQLAEIEELIKSKKVGDYATAEEFYSMKNKLAEPSGGKPFGFQRRAEPGLSEDKLKSLKEDPISFARNEALEAINDIRSGKVRLGQGGLTA